jgi:hypothetical protein
MALTEFLNILMFLVFRYQRGMEKILDRTEAGLPQIPVKGPIQLRGVVKYFAARIY